VAATERTLLAAALALPGMLPAGAAAQAMPEGGLFSAKYLYYRDWQPGADRMTVEAPSFYVLAPFAQSWTVEGSLTFDAVSGASPLYFNVLSGASGEGIHDFRKAGDLKISRYFDRWIVGAGAVISSEDDYLSRGGVLDLRWFTEDRNTTLAFSFGGAADIINSTNGIAENEHRNTVEFLVGITQALSPTAIIQSNLTHSYGHGYFNDPYKSFDTRPDYRRITAWLTRYNQFFPALDATLKVGYRYLDDSFGANSNMVEAAWVQPLPSGFTVTPNLRYLSQDAAWFYFDPPLLNGFVEGQPYTADTRLSAFGAITAGLLVAKTLPDGWTVDLKYEFYRQKSAWKLGGDGSPGLLPFSANWIQAGVAKAF
jgi:hypothetical protein